MANEHCAPIVPAIRILVYRGSGRGIGFSHVVSCGNEAGVTAADLIDYFVDDPSADVALGILETVRDPALAPTNPSWLTWSASCPCSAIQRASASGSIASTRKCTQATCITE